MVIHRIITPRVVAAVWGFFAGVTAYGYVGKSIASLTPVEEIMPANSLALSWLVTACFLFAGAIIPSGSGHVGACGRHLRAAGITACALLLTMWSMSYFVDAIVDGSRGWISGKNYAFLALSAMVSAWVIGRHRQ